ncbi:uncharacterized protein BX663DRAFT_307834 [Cokeromyces recurvatus]|uniref:uncharacterized protein n=1 Tax=Cokeromyces recurvatus TaxID=90255 RepID=UPI00221FB0BB|nr:uncharacterized protein BX663DRAFT_307834 [Cokeromyces recurvatus]KAI7905010.1 hypothetical protein BX663DRAFT_307834 [Cokeromyces recurvatus]
MDYSLHATTTTTTTTTTTSYLDSDQNQSQINTNDNILQQQNNNRSYAIFNNTNPSTSILFDNASSPPLETSHLIMNTRPITEIQESWNPHRLHHSDDLYNSSPIPALPHTERGIAGFVSKLYQCLQSNDNNQQYARWCKHDGKDMFIIDRIPGKYIKRERKRERVRKTNFFMHVNTYYIS